MKKIFFTIILFFLLLELGLSQDFNPSPKKSQFGIQTGIMFNDFIKGKQPESDRWPGVSWDYDINYFPNLKPSMVAGINYNWQFSKHLSLAIEVNYSSLKERIKYTHTASSAAPSIDQDTVDYTLTASTILTPIALKINFHHINIICGGYINEPFNFKVINGYKKSQGYSFNIYPNNFHSYNTIRYGSEIKDKMHIELGFYSGISYATSIKQITLELKASYGIGLTTIKSPNYRNQFFVLNAIFTKKRTTK